MKCVSPINLPSDGKSKLRRLVPCGKCYPCLQKRRNDWIFRIQQEIKVSTSCYFVTLTYEDGSLPRDDNDNPTVSKRDVQLFLKRLRKSISPYKIRYFLVSEYGGKTFRPHYHMILFNYPHDKRDVTNDIKLAWNMGFISVSPITPQRVAYVTKYCMQNTYLPDMLKKTFMLCSRRPAIGSNYISDATKNFHKENLETTVRMNGYRHSLPKYYIEKIFDRAERWKIKMDREYYSQQKAAEFYNKYFNYDIWALENGLPTMETQIKEEYAKKLYKMYKNDSL